MAGVGAMFGIGPSAGAQGLSYQPGSANITSPVTQQQAQDAYTSAQGGITNQQNFLQALQAQNGVGNQSAVYNQLAGIANGSGPNPAQAQLNQNTAANTANQAALMAGQRGAGANTGLIARQAAQQGAANQQQAVGQAATMNANQQLNAVGAMGNLATNQVGQQAAATGALTGAQQSEQGLLLNQISAQNNANVANQANINNSNTSMAQQGAKAQSGILSGVAQGIALAHGGQVPHYDQGTIAVQPNLAPQAQPSGAPGAPKSFVAKALKGGSDGMSAGSAQGDIGQSSNQVGQALGSGIGSGLKGLFGHASGGGGGDDATGGGSDVLGGFTGSGGSGLGGGADMAMAKGGAVPKKVPAMVSPGEVYIPPKGVKEVAKGKDPIKAGSKIPGKASVKGDSLKNDTVPKTLEEGGIVLPKSVMESKHPHWEAHKFVSAIMARNKGLKR